MTNLSTDCTLCKHYRQHYAFRSATIYTVSCGHCCVISGGKTKPNCDYWQQKKWATPTVINTHNTLIHIAQLLARLTLTLATPQIISPDDTDDRLD